MPVNTEFEELKQVIATGKKDALVAYIDNYDGGADALLDTIFRSLPEYFRPEKARGQQADFQYRINTANGVREFFVRVKDGVCEAGAGTVENPRVTMTVKQLPEFLRLLTGKINGMQAFLTGKVKLTGDMFYATKFENWFDRP
ncbi:MAG TPA: SCP2 sterol-binding domain-containing protein [Micromonospora sp.]